MKAFASQVCFGLCMLLVGCGGDDEAPTSTAAGSTSGGGSGGSGGSATDGGSGGEAGGAGAPAECDSPPSDSEIEIAGAYSDGYGVHRIDDEVWQMGASAFELIDVSNDEHWAIAENAPDNEYNAGLYSRFDWTYAAGQLYFCQSAYAAATEEEAREAPAADASDLAAGCGENGFSWSTLTPMELIGDYRDDFGGPHAITPNAWEMGSSVFLFLEFSNEDGWAVAQNECTNAYFPGLYSRFEWMAVEAGEGGAAGAAGAGGAGEGSPDAYFCQTGYNLDSAEAALELEPADRADLASGCNGYPWSQLFAQDP